MFVLLQGPATSGLVAIGDLGFKNHRHYLLKVVQISLIGHNQAAPRTPLESPCMAHDGCAGVSGKGIGLEKRGKNGVSNYNHGVSKKDRHSKRGLDERTVADVLAQAITAVQSQKIPAEEAMKAAMETIGASQKAALDLLLYAAQAQAEVVHELLANDGAKARSLVSAVGDLMLGAVERSPEVIGVFAAGLAAFLDAAAAPVKPPPEYSTSGRLRLCDGTTGAGTAATNGIPTAGRNCPDYRGRLFRRSWRSGCEYHP